MLELEGLRLRVVDGDADHVARQHIAGELQAVKTALRGAGQGLRQGGLADAGDVFDEEVPFRYQAHEGGANGAGLAVDDARHRGEDGIGLAREAIASGRALERLNAYVALSRELAGAQG